MERVPNEELPGLQCRVFVDAIPDPILGRV